MDSIHIYTDGGARGNPGPGAVGVVAVAHPSGREIYKGGEFIGDVTNNVAEYRALIAGLKWLENFLRNKSQISGAVFHCDSQLIVNQVKGIFKVRDATLLDCFFTVKELEDKIKAHIAYVLIPREKNFRADLEVNKALDERNK